MAKHTYLVTVGGLTPDGAGRALSKDEIILVHGALPNEIVRARTFKKKSKFHHAIAVEILEGNPVRTIPKCPHFGVCSGCNLQHMPENYQLGFKEATLQALMQKECLDSNKPLKVIKENSFNYRLKARFGLKWVVKKNKVVIGFRERGNRFITDTYCCPILHKRLEYVVFKLPQLIQTTSIKDAIPQVEVVTDEKVVAIIIRHLKPFNLDDMRKIQCFSKIYKIDFYLQSGGVETITPVGSVNDMSYIVANCKIKYYPYSFIQINKKINIHLVTTVLKELQLDSNDCVIDFFCGIGNFSIPIAKQAKKVLGFEYDSNMLELAEENAGENLCKNISFSKQDLSKVFLIDKLNSLKGFNKIVLDPPRSGAASLISQLNFNEVNTLVYVSCNAKTLVSDAKILVSSFGFNLKKTILLDMFPQTSHFETVMVFKK